MEEVKKGYTNWYKFDGRSTRTEYWGVIFINALIVFVSAFFQLEAIAALVSIAQTPIGIGLGIRRMHDAGVSGWWLLVPFVNFIYSFTDSEAKTNKWGPNPKNKSVIRNEDALLKHKEPSFVENSDLNTSKNELIESSSSIQSMEKKISELETVIAQKKDILEAESEMEVRKSELRKKIAKLEEDLKNYE